MNENKQEWESQARNIMINEQIDGQFIDMFIGYMKGIVGTTLAEAREDCIRTSNSGRKMYEIGVKEERERIWREVNTPEATFGIVDKNDIGGAIMLDDLKEIIYPEK